MAEPDVSSLLSVQQAIRIIDEQPVTPGVVEFALDASVGYRLAQDLVADRDFPAFRKSLMDGYAVRCTDVTGGRAELRVVGKIAAGQTPARGIEHGEAMAIMTGAALPNNADGVVPIEDVAARADVGSTVKILRAGSPQRYVAARGSDCGYGDIVLKKGTLIGPAQIAVMASIGATSVQVFARPRVAVLGTGSELVGIDQKPGQMQIRDSNTHMLAALLSRLGCDVVEISTAGDDPVRIRESIERAMQHDALFVTGGMSMGEFDHVPAVLRELGVQFKISKLKMKPGKPFVFGVGKSTERRSRVRGNDSDEATKGMGQGIEGPGGDAMNRQSDEATEDAELASAASPSNSLSDSALSTQDSALPARNPPFIFGLPGNPVSVYVCTVRLAARLLTRLSGGNPEDRWLSGRLDAGVLANGPREFYQPAIRHWGQGQHSIHTPFATITPLQWRGSSDLFTLSSANVLLVRAENEPAMPKGTVVRVLEL